MDSISELAHVLNAAQRISEYHRKLKENILYFKLRIAFSEGNFLAAETFCGNILDSADLPSIKSDTPEDFLIDLISDGELVIKGLKTLQKLPAKEFNHYKEYFDLCSALHAANTIFNQFSYTFANHKPVLSDKGWINHQIVTVHGAGISEANGIYQYCELVNNSGSFQRLGTYEGKQAIFRIYRTNGQSPKVWQLIYFFALEMQMQNVASWSGIPPRYNIPETVLYKSVISEENALPPLGEWKLVSKAENLATPTISICRATDFINTSLSSTDNGHGTSTTD